MTTTKKQLTASDISGLEDKLQALLAGATQKLWELKEEWEDDEEELDDTTKKTYLVPVTLVVELTEKEVWDITNGESDLVSNIASVDGVQSATFSHAREV